MEERGRRRSAKEREWGKEEERHLRSEKGKRERKKERKEKNRWKGKGKISSARPMRRGGGDEKAFEAVNAEPCERIRRGNVEVQRGSAEKEKVYVCRFV